MCSLKRSDPQVYRAILDEAKRENDNLELIASENFVSEEVLEVEVFGVISVPDSSGASKVRDPRFCAETCTRKDNGPF